MEKQLYWFVHQQFLLVFVNSVIHCCPVNSNIKAMTTTYSKFRLFNQKKKQTLAAIKKMD